MKNYYVILRIQAGEFQKISRHLVQADSDEDAYKQAVLNEAHHPDDLEEVNGGYAEPDWAFHYKLEEVRTVPPTDYEVLSRYF